MLIAPKIRLLLFRTMWLSLFTLSIMLLAACGGGGSDKKVDAGVSVSAGNNSLQASSATSSNGSLVMVKLGGTVTYDYVPHNINYIGLNYSATERRTVRGAVVELLNENGVIQYAGITGSDGQYSFNVPQNVLLKVRVKAELLRKDSPTWDFTVTDNTNNNALYALDGALVSTGNADSQRNLHAASGWDGVNYTSTRAAAPFAILDNIYIASARLLEAGNNKNFPPLAFCWSTKNKSAKGDISLGEINTSSYASDSNTIYVLGDANNDIDEYDSSVLLHEWGHYLENSFFRSDSIGGDHSDGKPLDGRVSMSEGFSNAFSTMMINDPNYADAGGLAQASGFTFNISKKNRVDNGFYNEDTVGSIFYNFYISSSGKAASDFAPIFQILSDTEYYNSDALTSIFSFYAQLKQKLPGQAPVFNHLMLEQRIYGTDEYGTGEINNAGLSISLPLYKNINPDNTAINVCSSPEFGKYNKLANAQFIKFAVTQPGLYKIDVKKSGGADVTANPEIILHHKAFDIMYIENTVANIASGTINLINGTYIIEVYDLSNRDAQNNAPNTLCFDVRVTVI